MLLPVIIHFGADSESVVTGGLITPELISHNEIEVVSHKEIEIICIYSHISTFMRHQPP